jgi:secreted Zn-dependent insulinase-like peptidase
MRRSNTHRYQTPYTHQKFSAKELSVLSHAKDADKKFALPKANPFLCDGVA